MKILQIFIDSNDEELLNKYKSAAIIHNEKLRTDECCDSGFDLYAPITLELSDTILYNYRICCAMVNEDMKPYAYALYARSSIYKTPLRLANNVGIIDSGYRGHICAAFDIKQPTTIQQYARYVQLCLPDLSPFIVQIVPSITINTNRGSNGFGSTGV
jgi:dUTP pyrophosphatase